MRVSGSERAAQVCKPNSVCPDTFMSGEATISLGRGLLLGSSDLPESFPAHRWDRSEQLLLSYMVLLQVGFVVRSALLSDR